MRFQNATIPVAVLAIVGGIVLHIYQAFFLAFGSTTVFLIALWLLSTAPYVLCGAIMFSFRRHWPAAVASVLALVADLAMHYSVFINPVNSTAGIGLLFMPLINLFVIAPAGLLIGWVATKPIRDPDAS